MIDTVALIFDDGRFHITDTKLFHPDAQQLILNPYAVQNKQGRVEAYQNPTAKDRKDGVYKPRLTLTRRSYSKPILKVELSVPKLLYGNNFDELDDSDFDAVVEALQSVLGKMGVMVAKEAIASAKISKIDYSKNFVFDDRTTVSSILSMLNKAKLSNWLDLTERRFQDQGHAFHLFCKSHEFIAYDKIAELTRSKSKAVEKEDREYNPQMSLFDVKRRSGYPIEILRVERRLKGRQKMKRVFKGFGLSDDLQFRELFSKGLSKKLIQMVWNDLLDGLKYVAMEEMSVCETFVRVAEISDLKPQAALAQSALIVALREGGERVMRRAFKAHYHPRSLDRLLKSLRELDLPYDRVKFQPLFDIHDQILTYKPIKLSHYGIL